MLRHSEQAATARHVSKNRHHGRLLVVGVLFAYTLLLPFTPGDARAASNAATQASETFGVSDVDRLSIDQRLLLVSIQGIVNRDGPVLWLRSGAGQSPGLPVWEGILPELRGMTLLDYAATLRRFAPSGRFAGIVVVDPTIEQTYNIATNLAGRDDLLIATPATLPSLMALGLQVRRDLRGEYLDEAAAFTANLAFFARSNQSMALKALRWSGADYLYGAPERGRDLAIQQRYWTFSKSTLDGDLGDFYRTTIGPVRELYGVAEDENLDVYRASEAGKVWLGMGLQLQYNLSLFRVLPPVSDYIYRQPSSSFQPATRAPGNDQVLISFIMTEGDNPFFVINQMQLNWHDTNRGQVPIGWTIAPQMLDIAPTVLQYYYETATPNDYFLAGASGYAYYHVNAMNFTDYPQLLGQLTPEYLRRLDIRLIRNFGDWLGYQMSFYDRLQLTASAYPEILGWVEGHGVPNPKTDPPVPGYERTTAVQLDGKYLDIPFSAWCDGDFDVDRAVTEIKDFIAAHPDRPLPVLVGMDQKRATPSTVRAIMDRLGPSYRYVRPDILYRSRPTTIDTVSTPQISATSVSISWATDEFSTGSVEVWTNGSVAVRSVSEPDRTATKHELTIGQLEPEKTYTYRIIALDADGNTTQTSGYTFTTLSVSTGARHAGSWFAGLVGLLFGSALVGGAALREWLKAHQLWQNQG